MATIVYAHTELSYRKLIGERLINTTLNEMSHKLPAGLLDIRIFIRN